MVTLNSPVTAHTISTASLGLTGHGRVRRRERVERRSETVPERVNERRPARHGQWRTPWVVSPEARWPTHVFGKSFLGDDGVKLTREYILSRIFFTRRSIVKSYQSQSSRMMYPRAPGVYGCPEMYV